MANPLVRLARSQILRVLDGQRVQIPTSVGLLEVESKTDDVWHPLVRREVVPEHMAALSSTLGSQVPAEIWANDIYEVLVYDLGEMKHLSIKRKDRAAVRNWRHFQQIKNEVVGDFCEAVELFPSETRIADNANQYHLWALTDPDVRFPFGFGGGAVTIRDEDVEAWNQAGTAGRQEPMQPGLKVGSAMQAYQEKHGIDIAAAGKMVSDATLKAMGQP